MAAKSYGPFHAFMQRLASTRFGSWYFSKTLQPMDAIYLRLGGKRPASRILAGLPVVVVTARGAKSGKPRSVPLVYIRDEDNPDQFALVATNFGRAQYPAWYGNLKANPDALGTIDGDTKRYLAHEAEGEEYARFWRLAEDTYHGYPKYRERIAGRRKIPIMVMRPVAANSA